MQNQQKRPLILTLKLDCQSQYFFNEQRSLYFPRERNFLKAHLTLFHQLPDEPFVYQYLSQLNVPRFNLQVNGLLYLGAGVAYVVESEELFTLHKNLKSFFNDYLIAQDQQKFRPHVVIQNKVEPLVARGLLQKLQKEFISFKVSAIGLSIWRYLGGPWEFLADYDFDDS